MRVEASFSFFFFVRMLHRVYGQTAFSVFTATRFL